MMCPNSSIGAMRVVWTLLLLTTVTLAGCSDDPAPEVEDPTFDEFDAPVAPDRGVIRGVVVDTAIVPLAGATVTLAGLERSTTTNENGAFQFDDLEPGSYFLEVRLLGYETVQSGTSVEAGEISSVLRRYCISIKIIYFQYRKYSYGNQPNRKSTSTFICSRFG